MFSSILALSMPGGGELLVILLLAIILFGANRLPELARGLGKAMREFQKAKNEFDQEVRNLAQVDETPSRERSPLAYSSPNDIVTRAEPSPLPHGEWLPSGRLRSPFSAFEMDASTKAPGDQVFDANTGQPFQVPEHPAPQA